MHGIFGQRERAHNDCTCICARFPSRFTTCIGKEEQPLAVIEERSEMDDRWLDSHGHVTGSVLLLKKVTYAKL